MPDPTTRSASNRPLGRFDAADRAPLIAVLGASGFIGSTVATALARRPVRLRLAARGPSPIPRAAADAEAVAADLTDRRALAEVVSGADVVLNLLLYTGGATWRAAEADPRSEPTNVGVTRDLVRILRADTRPGPRPIVVVPGSTSQLGTGGSGLVDGTEVDEPSSVYDRQKSAAEKALLDAAAEGVLRGVSPRLPTVFGAAGNAVDRGVVTAMARRALAGEPLTVWDGGGTERDLLHVRDVAEAVLACVDHADALSGRRWLIGSGRGTTVRALFTAIAEVVAEQTGRPPVDVVSVPAPEHATETDFRSIVADPARFRAVTGWRAALDLRTALTHTVTALIAEGSRVGASDPQGG
ncbi:nucleoside-diphosphate-sugar epimerase [Actinoalloteichus hoggarensis]|uniref:3 beta-hydroxysteroid dehydrogenase/Delta 5-->4-isomerase n=1 Tax=Actinoalloteichus hoggarensis TaxID=1470176 RepID=A0A221VYZ1_9PSEU|nr:NAD(P)-dependent oxidoreductase [Actinoalloteichus hoggarensis]ASO18763.1 3 beta-hydroxysteroid dehydrogenase/Delta 5-->4-isomerase [Actinoalloteichus hoggarensis]MBB5919996.1 nucleoside-diphosphate-sugar epimerase [Actinoalloteichus hoggarensis]